MLNFHCFVAIVDDKDIFFKCITGSAVKLGYYDEINL